MFLFSVLIITIAYFIAIFSWNTIKNGKTEFTKSVNGIKKNLKQKIGGQH